MYDSVLLDLQVFRKLPSVLFEDLVWFKGLGQCLIEFDVDSF